MGSSSFGAPVSFEVLYDSLDPQGNTRRIYIHEAGVLISLRLDDDPTSETFGQKFLVVAAKGQLNINLRPLNHNAIAIVCPGEKA